MFTGGPLISDQLEKELPQFRYAPYTSEVAKQVGKIIGTLPRIGPDSAPLSSPIVVDNYIRAWGGTLGGYVVNMLDKGLHAAGVGEEKNTPAEKWTEYPIVKEFFSHFPSQKAQSIVDFRENIKGLEETKASIEDLMNQAKNGSKQASGQAMNLMNSVDPNLIKEVSGPYEALVTGGKALRAIQNNNSMSPADKRQLMDTITFQMMSAAERGNKIFNQAKH